ncbi:MAG: adenosylcobinamide-GDP ribazoletransferase [Nakamurella sp.]
MLQALSFLTIFGRGSTPRPGSLPYFPIVGALVGLAVGYAWWGAGRLWPPLVAAAIALLIDAVVTGMLHLDGLSDSGDGLIAPMDLERRLTVMRDPSVGAFGAVTLIIVLLLRLSVFASVPAAPLTVAAMWCVSRSAMVVMCLTMPYARSTGGLASAFLGARHNAALLVTLVLGAVIAVPLVMVESGWWGLVPIAATALGALLVALLARARIGGFTGDVLGAAGVIGETCGLLALAAL